MPTLYTFEAKSIQNYILDSSKLKDMIGASEQIEYLCTEGGLLDNVLKALNLEGQFFRRAGGAFTVQFEQEAEAKRFQSLWSYCVRQQLPGLSFIQNIQSYVNDNEIKGAIKQLNRNNEQRRNQLAADFPVAGPLVARYRRTGGPAVNRQKEETLDAVTYSKRRAFKSLHLLQKKVDPENLYHWPTDFTEDQAYLPEEKIFPLLPDNPYIGIIHADGNSLGSIVKNTMQEIPAESYQSAALNFSKALEEATLNATHLAIRQTLAKHATHGTEMIMPARPLVVGGDDLSFIVRGDLALAFTETFLEAFEQETEQAFEHLRKEYAEMSLPSHLTACAGIAFIKSRQPLYQAYTLADSLCRHAKKIAREHKKNNIMPSALAFHRVTTSLLDDYETILKRELTIEKTTNENVVLSMQPYCVGKVNEELTPRFSELKLLADSLKDQAISQGTVRELLNLLYLDHWDLAKQRFERWRAHLADNEIKQNIMNSLEAITGKEHPALPHLLKKVKVPDKQQKVSFIHYSPLGDALAFNSVRKGSRYE